MSDRVTYDAAMRTLPGVLRNSESMRPLGQTTAKALQEAEGDTQLACIYARIGELPEELLDILAVDFGINWYDYNYDLETKRNVIRESFLVYKYLGTVGSLRRALSVLWPESAIKEWFEYSGDPYHFKVTVTGLFSAEIREKTLNIININKNVRSVLDEVEIIAYDREDTLRIGGPGGMQIRMVIPQCDDQYDRMRSIARTGGPMGQMIRI